ncbi:MULTISPECIES: multifunctional CCA addition/repair protein [unclassified Duganella]|uniref:multifunctional CCA addition/repair protein n=1 Tax=unclassified Duganella TaxID=2636909 RepID=UPI000881C9E8|nr:MULTISPECIES: multifunctional CCA addition/repair protein [unclassified Duganella]SDG97093.1 tRNA nucleotidyltransferase (CCA-adding enzyme) [Duganella sp. OV458]SDJ45294.1 tRNA nucleotidyltransferase (CCA-adding enzyme) [Duganella sp. OV510]
MQTYVVGGAVRDALLGLPVKDHDHVVVGATPDDMLAKGFRPVGKDFPVFLHPQTQEEYALARTERKTAPGYKGFVFHTSADVTLEEDLVRRDLTINAMARADDGSITDPYGGQRDIEQRIFRHVSDAFAEDPVRILRLARFAARFSDFTVAPETNELMKRMVAEGEVDALVAERVWQELARGLMEHKPSRMFAVLRDCGALVRILPELDALWGVPQPEKWHPEIDTGVHVMQVIDCAAKLERELPVRVACLMHDLGKGVTPSDNWPAHHGHEGLGVKLVEQVCKRLRVPTECRDLAVMTTREHGNVGRALQLRANTIVTLFERCDAFRKPARFTQMLLATECDARGRIGPEASYAETPFPQLAHLEAALAAARGVNAGEIAQGCADNPQRIPERVHAARVRAVKAALKEEDEE